MKRQARPFVVETKRSRKAPTNLWASTPLLQQELAAASAPEPRAEAIFADRSKDQAAEPARRILQSLIVEVPAPIDEAEADEPEEPAPRRRTRRDGDVAADGEMRAEPARRGRPRRAVAAEPTASDVFPSVVVAAAEETKIAATRSKAPIGKESSSKASSSKASPSRASAGKATANPSPATGPSARKSQATPAATPSLPDVTMTEADATIAAPAPRSRAARKPAAAALLPGERWKRRLPQRLW